MPIPKNGVHVQWHRQAALAAGLFALGGAAYWLEYNHRPRTEAADEQSKKILSLKDTSVESVRIVDATRTFDLKCLDLSDKLCKPGDNSKWELTSPMRLRADDTAGNSLLSTISNVAVTETIDLKDETPEKRQQLLKEYGLDPAARAGAGARRLTLKTSKGEITLHVGLAHPIGEGLFSLVERDGKPDETRVHILPTQFKSNFEHDLTFWRDKKLVSAATHEIDAFRLSGGKGGVIEAGKRDGQWVLKSGTQELAGDIETTDTFLSALTFLSAKSFVDKAALTGAKPVLTLQYHQQRASQAAPSASPSSAASTGAPAAAEPTDEPVTITFMRKGPAAPAAAKGAGAPPGAETRVYATVSNADPVFEVEASALERMDKKVDDLRQTKLITSVERFTARKLAFEGKPLGGQPLVMTNTDGKWVSPDGTGKKELDATKVQALLDKLSGNRIRAFMPSAKAPAGEKGGIVFTLSDEHSDAKRKLVFWKFKPTTGADKSEQLYARDLASKRDEALLIDYAVAADLPWSRAIYDKADPAAKPSAATSAPTAPAAKDDGHGHAAPPAR